MDKTEPETTEPETTEPTEPETIYQVAERLRHLATTAIVDPHDLGEITAMYLVKSPKDPARRLSESEIRLRVERLRTQAKALTPAELGVVMLGPLYTLQNADLGEVIKGLLRE